MKHPRPSAADDDTREPLLKRPRVTPVPVFNVFEDRDFFCGAIAPWFGPVCTHAMRLVSPRFAQWLTRHPVRDVLLDIFRPGHDMHGWALLPLLHSQPLMILKQLGVDTWRQFPSSGRIATLLVMARNGPEFEAGLDFFFNPDGRWMQSHMELELIKHSLRRGMHSAVAAFVGWCVKHYLDDTRCLTLMQAVSDPEMIRHPYGLPKGMAFLLPRGEIYAYVLTMLYSCLLVGDTALQRFKHCVEGVFPRDYDTQEQHEPVIGASVGGLCLKPSVVDMLLRIAASDAYYAAIGTPFWIGMLATACCDDPREPMALRDFASRGEWACLTVEQHGRLRRMLSIGWPELSIPAPTPAALIPSDDEIRKIIEQEFFTR